MNESNLQPGPPEGWTPEQWQQQQQFDQQQQFEQQQQFQQQQQFGQQQQPQQQFQQPQPRFQQQQHLTGQPSAGQSMPGTPSPAKSQQQFLNSLGLVRVLSWSAPVLAMIGLLMAQQWGLWAWSLFLLAASCVQAGAYLSSRPSGDRLTLAWIGVGGMVMHWVLIVLPYIASNQGFVSTLACVSAGLAVRLAERHGVGELPESLR